jgi:two-component system, OmpR family, phosphate regulon response regulator PhoB
MSAGFNRPMSKVLVVDGDSAARDALVTCLKFVGMEAHGAENAAAAQCWLETDAADVLVLSDEVARSVETDRRASVIVLARHPAEPAMQPHLRIDETLRRPIALSRVVERVESLIEERKLRGDVVLEFGSLTLEVANGLASSGGSQATLGFFETRLLAHFIGRPDKVFSRVQLLQRLWPANAHVAERTVDVHIRRLRLALAQLGCAGYIQTVRCSGYRFSAF